MTGRPHDITWSILVGTRCPVTWRDWPLEVRAEMERAIDTAMMQCAQRWPGFRIVEDISTCVEVPQRKAWRLYRRITIAEASAA
jgi:hypothetical protein